MGALIALVVAQIIPTSSLHYLSYPFTKNKWLPIILLILFSSLITFFALFLEGKRDMGAGFIPQKEGRANAKKSLLSIPGLFTRLNKGSILAWFSSFVVLSAACGSIYKDLETFLYGIDFVKQMFTHVNTTIEASFTSTIILVMIALITILPISIMNRLFLEEKNFILQILPSQSLVQSVEYF